MSLSNLTCVFVCSILLMIGGCFTSVNAQNPGWRQITDEDGLPGMTVYQILQDTQGNVWMATNSGLCRFDGREFEVMDDLRLQDNEILELKKDHLNRLWLINLSGELSYLYQDSIYRFYNDFLKGGVRIQNFWLLKDGLLFIGKEKISNSIQMYFYQFDSLHSFQLKDQIRLEKSISSSFKGSLFSHLDTFFYIYIGANSLNLVEIINDSLVISTTDFYSASKNITSIKNLKIFPKLVQSVSNVYVIDKESIKLLTPSTGIIQKIIEIEEEYYIPYNNQSVFKYNGKDKELSTIKSIFDIDVNCIFKDIENNYWIGTMGKGVFVAPTLDIEYLNSTNNKLPTDYVYTIYGNNDKIYIGQTNGWLTIYENEKKVYSKKYEGFGGLRSIVIDEKKELVLGFDKGVVKPRLEEGLNFKYDDLIISGANKRLKYHKGKLYAGTSRGTEVYEKINGKEEATNILPIRTYGLSFDQDDRLWIGTTEGIFYAHQDTFLAYLNKDFVTTKFSVNDMAASSDGTIWVALKQHGVLSINKNKPDRIYNVEDGLTSNNCRVVSIEEDTVWIGTNKGLNKLVISTEEVQSLDTNNGLPSNEITAIYTQKEKIWIGTPKGLSILPKPLNFSKPVSPKTFFNLIKINGEEIKKEPTYDLKFNQNDLQIGFTSIAYFAKGKEKYHYRMLGLDTTWQSTRSRSVFYYGLTPGDYEFEVSTSFAGVEKYKNTAKMKFKIRQAWWKIWWVQLLGVFILMGFSGLFIYRKQRQLIRKERKENQIQEQISNLKRQALQSQMNPHFIFNTLNAIQDFLLTNEQEAAIDSLSHFARMISFIFDKAKEKNISLKEELEFLNHYTTLEKLRFGERVDIKWEIDPAIESRKSEIELPPLLIQPLLENAFKHGLHHKLEKGNLLIKFVPFEGFNFKCIIQDDGVGRGKVLEYQENNFHYEGKTSGMKITKERLAIFHNEHNRSRNDYISITDLKDHKNNPIGTKVEVWI